MTEADALLDWIEKLSRVGFASLLGLLLFGNFAGIWVWGRFHKQVVADLQAQLVKEEAEKNEWKSMALGLLTPLETTLETRKRRG
jgi:hypothetical protein